MMWFAFFVHVLACTLVVTSFNLLHHYRSGLNPLKTEVELFLDHSNDVPLPPVIVSNPWYPSTVEQRKIRGREAVQSATQTIQRLIIQLDRSDGRSDMTSEVLANKFYDFLSTCLRSDGLGWTAALGPMEYIGMKLTNYVTEVSVNDERIRVVDVAGICNKMCTCMIDLDLNEASSITKISKFTQQNKECVLDLSLSLTRLALRYALYKDQLESHTSPTVETETETNLARDIFNSIELNTMTAAFADITGMTQLSEVIIPSNRRLDVILHYDMLVDEEDLPVPGSSRVIVRKQDLKKWIEKNPIN